MIVYLLCCVALYMEGGIISVFGVVPHIYGAKFLRKE